MWGALTFWCRWFTSLFWFWAWDRRWWSKIGAWFCWWCAGSRFINSVEIAYSIETSRFYGPLFHHGNLSFLDNFARTQPSTHPLANLLSYSAPHHLEFQYLFIFRSAVRGRPHRGAPGEKDCPPHRFYTAWVIPPGRWATFRCGSGYCLNRFPGGRWTAACFPASWSSYGKCSSI